jgi:hypothetical protein
LVFFLMTLPPNNSSPTDISFPALIRAGTFDKLPSARNPLPYVDVSYLLRDPPLIPISLDISR